MNKFGYTTELIWARRRVVNDKHRDRPLTSPHATTVWLIEQGSVVVTYDGQAIKIPAGSWLLQRSADGWQTFEPGTTLISIRFTLNLITGKPLFDRPGYFICPADRVGELTDAGRGLASFADEHSAHAYIYDNEFPPDVAFDLEARFNHWLATYCRTMVALGEAMNRVAVFDERVAAAIRLIDQHAMVEKFTEERLAESVGLSVNQLGRLFRQETGDTLYQYYERRRLNLAQRLLSTTTLTLKEIAYRLAFSSPPHFSYWFRMHGGSQPSAYRRYHSRL